MFATAHNYSPRRENCAVRQEEDDQSSDQQEISLLAFNEPTIAPYHLHLPPLEHPPAEGRTQRKPSLATQARTRDSAPAAADESALEEYQEPLIQESIVRQPSAAVMGKIQLLRQQSGEVCEDLWEAEASYRAGYARLGTGKDLQRSGTAARAGNPNPNSYGRGSLEAGRAKQIAYASALTVALHTGEGPAVLLDDRTLYQAASPPVLPIIGSGNSIRNLQTRGGQTRDAQAGKARPVSFDRPPSMSRWGRSPQKESSGVPLQPSCPSGHHLASAPHDPRGLQQGAASGLASASSQQQQAPRKNGNRVAPAPPASQAVLEASCDAAVTGMDLARHTYPTDGNGYGRGQVQGRGRGPVKQDSLIVRKAKEMREYQAETAAVVAVREKPQLMMRKYPMLCCFSRPRQLDDDILAFL